jgi:hypothetical protein
MQRDSRSFIDRYFNRNYARLVLTLHGAFQILFGMFLVTLWVVSKIDDLSDAEILKWPLMHLGNVITFFAGLVIILVTADSTRLNIYVIVVSAIINFATLIADLLSLIWFSIIYSQCLDASGTDPLCSTVTDLEEVGIYYLTATSGFIVCNLGFFLALIMYTRDEVAREGSGVITNIRNSSAAKEKRFGKWIHTLLSGVHTVLSLLVVEVWVLTPYSHIKFLWFAHVAWIIPGVIAEFVGNNLHSVKIGAASALLSFFGSCIGVSLMAVYYENLCNRLPPEQFSDMTDCDIGVNPAIYFIVLHSLFALGGLLRIGAFFLDFMRVRNIGLGSNTVMVGRDSYGRSIVSSDADSRYFYDRVYDVSTDLAESRNKRTYKGRIRL